MNIEPLIREWDGETVIARYDHPTGAWIFIAIHTVREGLSGGGTRMKPYTNPELALQDALRLSSAMTYKFAIAGIPRGGAKAVISVPADLGGQARSDLLRRYGTLVRQLGGLFGTGPDVGTSSKDMDIISETGAPYIYGCTPEAGGPGDSGPVTALGVLAGIEVTCGHLFGEPSVKGRRVLVQGAGSVGGPLIERLRAAGAEVMFSEIDDNLIRRFRDELGVKYVPPEAMRETDCDLFAPCALGGILNASTIPGLKCKAVVGAANNQLAEAEDAERLREAGVLYAPDYLVNMGGALALSGMEELGWSQAEAEARVVERVKSKLREVFYLAAAEKNTTEAAARRIAEKEMSRITDDEL
jgi:glutamate dehydrogenase/leucine dehydrogenase